MLSVQKEKQPCHCHETSLAHCFVAPQSTCRLDASHDCSASTLVTPSSPAKFCHHHEITTSSSINHLHLGIIAHCFNVCSTVLYDPPYLLVDLLSVFDINSPSNTQLKKHLHHGHGAGASPIALHCRSHLIAPPASTRMLDCPAPGHAATRGVHPSASSSLSQVRLPSKCQEAAVPVLRETLDAVTCTRCRTESTPSCLECVHV